MVGVRVYSNDDDNDLIKLDIDANRRCNIDCGITRGKMQPLPTVTNNAKSYLQFGTRAVFTVIPCAYKLNSILYNLFLYYVLLINTLLIARK